MKSGEGGAMNRISVAVHWVVIAVLVGMASCASSPAPKETKLKSDVVAAANINPNRRGTPQPVKLHVYYLKQDEAFLQANFSDLIQPDAPVIASDLIRRTESLIGPGETLSLDTKFDEQSKFIGVVAEFTRIDQAQWRSLAAVPPGSWKIKLNPFKGQKLLVTLENLSVDSAIVKD